MNKQRLIILGAGIKSIAHLTKENIAAIQQATIVLCLMNEPVMSQWIGQHARQVLSLNEIYFSCNDRVESYKKIVREVQAHLTKYNNVAFVVYGHPLLLSSINKYLLKEIDRVSIEILIQPGISSFDCLLADLEVDPLCGCYCVEASELLRKNKLLDSTNHLIIWQIGILEDPGTKNSFNHKAFGALKNKLLLVYPKNHPCVIYEGSLYPHILPRVEKTTLAELECENFSRLSTLYMYPQTSKHF
ncbi:tetrapyrrole methylase [Legionella birminghamensis]|uniref:Tetrapyrrole methylase n=1 Tax=Legionella birminghamensis TaxID=28083 RepID=A0A378ICG0_9GAMM|nr:SAM-dependent methyltransferase [Legionella birminghamensis]KTC66769.1 tetrapyrrole methylase [Legionella birminghamensis]STX32918.1 Uncharacterized protein yabN [Legionella birminghamensis]